MTLESSQHESKRDSMKRSNRTPIQLPIEIKASRVASVQPDVPDFVIPMHQGSMISDMKEPSMILASDSLHGASLEDSTFSFGEVENKAMPGMNYTMHVVGSDPAGNLTIQSSRRSASREQERTNESKERVMTILAPIRVEQRPKEPKKVKNTNTKRQTRKKPLPNSKSVSELQASELILDVHEKKTAKEMKRVNSLGGRCFSLTDRQVERPPSPQSSVGSSVVIAEGSRRAMSPEYIIDEEYMRDSMDMKSSFIPSAVPEEEFSEEMKKGDDDEASVLTEGSFQQRSLSPLNELSVGGDATGPEPPYRKILTPLAHRFPMEPMRDTLSRKDKNRIIHTPSSRLDTQRHQPTYKEAETSEYCVHSRLMGWKLTSPERRKFLLRLLEKSYIPGDTDDWNTDTEAETAQQAEDAKRIKQRGENAYHESVSRSILARAATPAGRMSMLRHAKPNSTVSRVLVDRMSILNDFQRTMEEERFANATKLRQSTASRQFDALGASTEANPGVGVNVKVPSITAGSIENLVTTHRQQFPPTSSSVEVGDTSYVGLGASSMDKNSSFLVNMRNLDSVEMPFDDSIALASQVDVE